MNILIVYAHPEPKSFNGALKDLALTVLHEQGHHVSLSDLYAMNFNPVAGKNDFNELKNHEYFQLVNEQRNATIRGTFMEDIRAEQEKVSLADFIIFQFPIWWAGPPAILKGWFDRVFAIGFTHDKGAYAKGNGRA